MLEAVLGFLTDMQPVAGAVLLLTGSVLTLIGTVGVLRFPDFYTRLHAASVTDTAGATLALLGMALLAPGPVVLFKLVIVWLFLFLTGPTASHALANAAHVAGLEPVIGKQSSASSDGA